MHARGRANGSLHGWGEERMQITMVVVVVVVAGGAPSHPELAMPTVNLHKWPTAHNMGNMPLCHICPGLFGGN